MSAENPRPTRDRSIMPLIWPRVVTGEDIEQIEIRMSQGSSRPAAVAGVICQEAADRLSWVQEIIPSMDGRPLSNRELFHITERANLYAEPANAFLSVEEYVRTGSLSSSFVDEMMKRTRADLSLLGEAAPPDQLQGLLALVSRKNWIDDTKTLAERLMLGASPIEIINQYAEIRIQRLPQDKSFLSRAYITELLDGRDRFRKLYDAMYEEEQERVIVEAVALTQKPADLDDFSGTEAAKTVIDFLQNVSAKKERDVPRIQELHGLLTDIGHLSEQLIPFMEEDEQELLEEQEISDLELYISTLDNEEGPQYLIKLSYMRDEGLIWVQLQEGLVDDLDISPAAVELWHPVGFDTTTPLPDEDQIVTEGLSIRERDYLQLAFHTDAKTAAQVKRLRERGRQVGGNTYFFFDQSGKYVKLALLDGDVKDDRPAVGNTLASSGRYVLSDITEEDINLNMNILNRVKKALEEETEYQTQNQGN